MKLFVYYAFHSTINTIKKLLKTWIGFIIIITFVAVILGLGVGFFADRFADKAKETIESELQEDTEIPDETDFFDAVKDKVVEKGFGTNDIVDLVVSLIIIGFFALIILTSKDTGGGFQPPDVVMLFPAPMKPQSVLLFRVACTAGTSLLVAVCGVAQLPNLIINVGMSIGGAIILVVAYGFLVMEMSLAQVAVFTVCSKVDFLKRNSKYILPGSLFAIVIAYAVYTFATGQDYITSLFKFFSGKYTFWVPFWGWLRGGCLYAFTGEIGKSLIYLAVTVVGIAAVIAIIWSMKVDFYEDAIAGTERLARKMENAKAAQTSGVKVRTKERSANLKRDGFNKGYGANVFFYKTLYNRFRFAKFKFVTVYMIVYTLVALLVSWFAKDFQKFDNFFFVGCALAVCAFFRTFGNPLEEDTSRGFFALIPESAFKKMFWSLLGSSTNTCLDLIVPVIAAAIFLKTNPAVLPGWFLFALSVDFFSTTVGAFIGVSVPGESGATIKQMIQVMFVYLGIGPSAACLAAGALLEQIWLFTLIGAVFNVVVGLFFYLLTPRFISNGNK